MERTGTDHYETTIAVESLGEDKTKILLMVEFEPQVDVNADALSEDISVFFRGCLKAMTKALNSSLPHTEH
ncbi:hypothetical protein COO09_24090 [Rhizorhabdus dicambivorans]|uniref:Uncharacterized protein n=1 Tax=Rhizorhabdus dicambivorans TaxID=1850238 RepID=A0A2A4FNI6_9SPHN|nr:hypothetical protein CMV14_08145 [Rhizorhabdus dicambivorans]PCE39717.1 hypothetical protein COO09_24090 [Rhizorhabdus dicambivorans]